MPKGSEPHARTEGPTVDFGARWPYHSAMVSDGHPAAIVGFEPIGRRASVSQEVIRRLTALVASGRLLPGDRLPPERELASILGVSRPSLRESLSALALLGVVVQSQGRGTSLARSLDQLPLEPYVLQLLMNRGRMHDFMELRRIIEPEAAAIAAGRVNVLSERELETAWVVYSKAVEQQPDSSEATRAGQAFHEAVIRATGNQSLINLMTSLSGLMAEAGHSLRQNRRDAGFDQHRAIYEAVLTRHAAEARRLMKRHLDQVEHGLLAPL
jgi:GntR family transcriptional repressor for pyruvate dehydrogenase complex